MPRPDPWELLAEGLELMGALEKARTDSQGARRRYERALEVVCDGDALPARRREAAAELALYAGGAITKAEDCAEARLLAWRRRAAEAVASEA